MLPIPFCDVCVCANTPEIPSAEITKLSADVEKAANVVNSSMTKVKSLEAQKSKYGASHEEIKADPHISKCKTFTMNNSKVLKGKQVFFLDHFWRTHLCTFVYCKAFEHRPERCFFQNACLVSLLHR